MGVLDRGVVDGHGGAFGEEAGDAAFGAGGQLVAQADVGEGAAHHDLVVAAAGAVGVEVGRGDAVLGEVLAGGTVQLDGAGGGDVVGGDGVAEDGEAAGAADVCDCGGGGGHAVEVGGLADVGGVGLPAVGVARGERRFCQFWSPSETVEYWCVNMSAPMEERTVSATSAGWARCRRGRRAGVRGRSRWARC